MKSCHIIFAIPHDKVDHPGIQRHFFQFLGVCVTMPEGTYMIFVDCTKYCARTGKTMDEVLQAGWDAGVGWQDGRMLHGPCHIRMNLAFPLSRV